MIFMKVFSFFERTSPKNLTLMYQSYGFWKRRISIFWNFIFVSFSLTATSITYQVKRSGSCDLLNRGYMYDVLAIVHRNPTPPVRRIRSILFIKRDLLNVKSRYFYSVVFISPIIIIFSFFLVPIPRASFCI